MDLNEKECNMKMSGVRGCSKIVNEGERRGKKANVKRRETLRETRKEKKKERMRGMWGEKRERERSKRKRERGGESEK